MTKEEMVRKVEPIALKQFSSIVSEAKEIDLNGGEIYFFLKSVITKCMYYSAKAMSESNGEPFEYALNQELMSYKYIINEFHKETEKQNQGETK